MELLQSSSQEVLSAWPGLEQRGWWAGRKDGVILTSTQQGLAGHCRRLMLELPKYHAFIVSFPLLSAGREKNLSLATELAVKGSSPTSDRLSQLRLVLGQKCAGYGTSDGQRDLAHTETQGQLSETRSTNAHDQPCPGSSAG